MICKLRLGVLCVAKVSMSVCIHLLWVCEVYTCPYMCVRVCGVYLSVRVCVFSGGISVVLVYNCDTHFFTFLYPRNVLPGHVTKPFLASGTSIDVNTNLSHDDHSNVYTVVYLSLPFACHSLCV